MEDYPVLPQASSSMNQDFTPPAVHFCAKCAKPFTSVTSRDRHLRYCKSNRIRSRPRSCQACNAAKTKCTFETPCLRCAKKDIECIYVASVRKPVVSTNSAVTGRPAENPFSDGLHPLLEDTAFFGNNEDIFDSDLQAVTKDITTYTNRVQPLNSPRSSSSTLSMQKSWLHGSFAVDDLLYNAETISLQPYSYVDYSFAAIRSTVPPKPGHWCAWMRGSVSLAVVTEQRMIESSDPNLLTLLELKRLCPQNNADIIIQALRSFPTMMQRRETFPWFIHPQSQLMSKSPGAALPDALTSCMSIAQMFASRTPVTKYLLRRGIRVEYRRFIQEIYYMSKFDLVASIQACVIYLIMFIVDPSVEADGIGLELIEALRDLSTLCKEICGVPASQIEYMNPSACWEDWIFVESQRRVSNLWFLIGCIVCVKTGVPCDPSQSYRTIPLPGPKLLWEARSHSEWEREYAVSSVGQINGLMTLGDLIDLQQAEYEVGNAARLDEWNAGVDILGSLLNLVRTMV